MGSYFKPTSGGATAFIGLTDTPHSYAGQAGLFTAVNPGETGLIFVPGGGGGVSLPLDQIGYGTGSGITSIDGFDAFNVDSGFGSSREMRMYGQFGNGRTSLTFDETANISAARGFWSAQHLTDNVQISCSIEANPSLTGEGIFSIEQNAGTGSHTWQFFTDAASNTGGIRILDGTNTVIGYLRFTTTGAIHASSAIIVP